MRRLFLALFLWALAPSLLGAQELELGLSVPNEVGGAYFEAPSVPFSLRLMRGCHVLQKEITRQSCYRQVVRLRETTSLLGKTSYDLLALTATKRPQNKLYRSEKKILVNRVVRIKKKLKVYTRLFLLRYPGIEKELLYRTT